MAFFCAFNSSTFLSTGRLAPSAWAGGGNANWSVDFDFVATSLASSPRLGGRAGGTTRGVTISTSGALLVAGFAGFTSAAGVVSINTRYIARLQSVGTTKSLYIKTHGGDFGTALVSVTDNNTYTFEVFGRTSTVSTLVFDFYGFEFTGGTYSETWGASNAPSTGTVWTGSNGNNLTLVDTTGTADSWWVFYSDGGAFTIDAVPGAYVLSGTAVGLIKSSVIYADAGAYSLTGTAVDLIKSSRIVADTGSYSIAGSGVSFAVERFIYADPGSYSIIGNSVNFISPPVNADGGFSISATIATNTSVNAIIAKESNVFAGVTTICRLKTGLIRY